MKMFSSCYRSSKSKLEGEDQQQHARSTLGWPRSKKLWGTYDPDWEDEEVHFKLQSHDSYGFPFELAGSLMFITLLDHGSPLEYHIIGSCSFNLQELFEVMHPLCISKKSFLSTSANHRAGGSGPGHVGARLGSNPHHESLSSDPCPIRSFNIDEPLVKNGKELGRVQCVIDAWWIDDHIARSSVQGRRSILLESPSVNYMPSSLTPRRQFRTSMDNRSNKSSTMRGFLFHRRED